MTNKIDYQKLREIAEKTKIAGEAPVMPFDQRINALNDFMKHFSPDIALALLDEVKRLEDTNIDAMCRIAELETNLAALAAENELARKAVQAFCDVVGDNTEVIAEVVGRDGVLVILEAMKATGNMPATDAFLAEVRAQGVDAAIEAAKNLVAQEYEYKDFKAAQSDCCMHPGSDLVGKVEMTEWLVDFAAQLRKGGNQ
ncbi:ead/Ea22-like family protein [Escherichia coli]|uniref:ead/Ea22-like family protein n=1 Tax=Escherichia coli TaxID=562 RepID=UPI0017626574|nr:ead/Ea22-like family protein [Escherichia coli]ELK7088489.1 ead/Ea22-like family protein [Escherichia coli]MDS1201431.1 ead/Ea22-like family protein [Escherichia coli]HAG8626868.1 ead/Ea22-like family protein [Escherichia coli]HAG9057604.1 ead/Ea22-like family protein [Escherichia coli]HCQ6435145.1 ead/Ea22-like family protein [Escherichia coli]